jgi:fructose-1,6-bisphosphatase I
MKYVIIAASICFLQGTTGFIPPSVRESFLRKAVTSELFSSIDNVEQPKNIASAASSKPKKKKLKTFSRYLEIESWKRGPAARDLEPVLRSVGEACKQINRIVQRAQTDDLYGVAVDAQGNALEDTNVQGEVQQKLDVVCNAIMLKQFCGSSKGIIAAVASEEEDEPRSCPDVMVSELFSNYKKESIIEYAWLLKLEDSLPSSLSRETMHLQWGSM